MSKDEVKQHPLAQMLEDDEPEAVEYWLHDDIIGKLMEDRVSGLISADDFAAKFKAWKADAIERLNASYNADTDASWAPLQSSNTPADDNAPPAIQGAFCEPTINELILRRNAGGISEAEFQKKAAVWKTEWVQKLNAMNPAVDHDFSFPHGATRALSTMMAKHPPSVDLTPRPVKRGQGGPSR